MGLTEQGLDLDELGHLADICAGLGYRTRMAIYKILEKRIEMNKKDLHVMIIGIIKSPIQTNTINGHIRKMESAGLIEMNGDSIKLKKKIDIRISKI